MLMFQSLLDHIASLLELASAIFLLLSNFLLPRKEHHQADLASGALFEPFSVFPDDASVHSKGDSDTESSTSRSPEVSSPKEVVVEAPESHSEEAKDEYSSNGMEDSVETLYETFDKYGCREWTTKYSEKMFQAKKEMEQRARHAFVVKKAVEGSGENFRLSLRSIRVQSPLVKPILAEVLDGYPDIEISSSDIDFDSPFIPFYHRMNELNSALERYTHQDILNPRERKCGDHLQLLHALLNEDLELARRESERMQKQGLFSLRHFWTLLPPGCLVAKRDRSSLRLYRVVEPKECSVIVKFVDWDGQSLGYRQKSLRYCDSSKDKKLIDDLEIFPLRHRKDSGIIAQRLKDRGCTFVRLKGHHYKALKGRLIKKGNTTDKNSNMLDERVIINAKTFYEYNYGRPRLSQLMQKDPDVKYPNLDAASHEGLSDEDLMICTPKLLGYCLRSRSWGKFHIENVSEICWDDAAFDSLVLEKQFKDLLLSVVDSQIRNGAYFDDFIKGKGRGLNMLLTGPTGVGKTLTSESIAEYMRKPLYTITASELGLTPSGLESELERIFKLVRHLDAVLLLDEADVYLQQRSVNDLKRNALVTVFLRVLEYYEGVLFLTTNRIEDFDPAFFSRIHITINFPELDADARRKIWASFMNMLMLKDKISDAELTEISENYDLNGRQIKNAIKTSQLLATRCTEETTRTSEIVHSVIKITMPKSVATQFHRRGKGGCPATST